MGAESGIISAPMEKKIAVVIVGVTDMQRAVDFYRSTLRLPLKFQTPHYSEFKTRGAVLALEKRNKITATGPALTFSTRSIKRDRDTLERKGARFWKELHNEPYGWVMMPYDSEGNIFEIVQYAPRKKSRQ